MKKLNYHLYLTDDEYSQVIHSLIGLKNNLIQAGKYTDVVDDLLVRLISAKKKEYKDSHKKWIYHSTYLLSYWSRYFFIFLKNFLKIPWQMGTLCPKRWRGYFSVNRKDLFAEPWKLNIHFIKTLILMMCKSTSHSSGTPRPFRFESER